MLHKLRNYFQRKWELSEKILLKAYDMIENNENRNKFCRMCGFLCYSILSCCGLIVGIWETYYRKKRLISILKCDEKILAIDINELLEKKSNTVYIGDDFTYNAVTDVTYLKNVKLVFGNADFRALDNMRCLKNLRFVMGELFLSSIEGLEKLKYVGGTIYYQNQEFDTLDEFVMYQKGQK